jgi:L-threonylcarbamoyladenylate synthase
LADELAARWWPGPLTLVLPKKTSIPDIVTAGLRTVGVRIPNHPVAKQLLEEVGVPIAAPSANRFTELSPTTADHVRKAFGDAVDIVEGSPSDVGIESTVIAIVEGVPKLLRPGMISLGEIEQIAAGTGAHPSPGMHEKHYSPRTPLIIVDDRNDLPGREGAYLWHSSSGLTARSIRMPADPKAYAARLYSVLHELDAAAWPWIAVEAPPTSPAWAAIRDRLERAARR